MASLSARLARAEAAVSERQQAALDAALAELYAWTAAHWTPAEDALWSRWLLNLPFPEDRAAAAVGSLEEYRAIMAQTPPLTSDEEPVLKAAWLRVPEPIRARLELMK